MSHTKVKLCDMLFQIQFDLIIESSIMESEKSSTESEDPSIQQKITTTKPTTNNITKKGMPIKVILR